MTRIGVMKHLRLLEDAGLVVTRLIYDRWIDKYRELRTSALTDLLSTLFASAAAAYASKHAHLHGLRSIALVHGYTTAFWWAAGIFALGLLVALLVLPPEIRSPAPTAEVSVATE